MLQSENLKTKPRIDEEIAKLLKSVVDAFEREDRPARERQIRKIRQLKLYWNNLSRIYWSETARDYRIASQQDFDDDQAYYDRPINVFKAFLETIIAALSVQIPAAVCVPGDADNPLDLTTAKAGNKIGELLYKKNDAMFLWLQALYVWCTEGMVACYNYSKPDKKFGTYKEQIYEDKEIEAFICPFCVQPIPDEEMIPEPPAESYDLDELDVTEPAIGMVRCPNCDNLIPGNIEKSKTTQSVLKEEVEKENSGICLEVKGGLYVKVAQYAKTQADTPYLIDTYDTHYANVLERYPDLRGKINKESGRQDYEQYARTNTMLRGEQPEDNVTVRNAWLRPSSFNVLTEQQCKKLESKFPDGVYVCLVNEHVANYYQENLDEHWTLTKNPLSDYLTHEPLGELLVNIQDIINDLISLTLQIIEHGVPQLWADPSVVNFAARRQVEVLPGVLTPTKPQGQSKNISDAFYETKASSISAELFSFYQIMQQLGQFVSGAMPSIFGGAQERGSETASEYAMSRSMALQRLQTPWKMLTIWWKDVFHKSILSYIDSVQSDQRFVERDENGNFINVFIRKTELAGKIGDVELEASDKMPVSDEQKAEVIMRLMELNNQEIMMALTSPENLPFIRKIVKIPEFKMPGEADRQKQLEEINELVNSIPIVEQPQVDPMQLMVAQQQDPMAAEAMMQPIERSSVPIDPDLDNHMIEAEVCRAWLIGEAGRLAKIENPDGYKNVLLHFKEHSMIVQQMQAQMAAEQAALTNPEGSNSDKSKSDKGSIKFTKKESSAKADKKVTGENNVQIPIQ
jgi:hypothetical protein